MTVNKERLELFAEALESGDYRQCKGRLRAHSCYEDAVWHCALGVATDVALNNGLQEALIDLQIPPDVTWVNPTLHDFTVSWYGWDGDPDPLLAEDEDGNEETIAGLNDAGWSFWQIAQAVRTRWLKDEG